MPRRERPAGRLEVDRVLLLEGVGKRRQGARLDGERGRRLGQKETGKHERARPRERSPVARDEFSGAGLQPVAYRVTRRVDERGRVPRGSLESGGGAKRRGAATSVIIWSFRASRGSRISSRSLVLGHVSSPPTIAECFGRSISAPGP